MRHAYLIVPIALVSVAALAGPPVPSPATVHEKVISWEQFGSPVSMPPVTCEVRREIPPPSPVGNSCDSPVVVTEVPLILRGFSLAPLAADLTTDNAYQSASCQASILVSIDGGATFKRLPNVAWSPRNFESTVYTLPVPVAIPKGAAIVRRLNINMWYGNPGQACAAQARISLTSE